jgi:hypothetical protein
MAEITDLPAAAALTGTDLLVVYQPGAASNKSRKVTLAAILASVVKTGDAATFGDVNATALNAPVGAIDALTVATNLTIGAALSKILTATASVAIGTLAASASQSVTMTVASAVVGDVVIVNPQVAMPAGLVLRSYVSGADTVTITVLNASAAEVSGASYSMKAVLLRVA